MMIYNCDHPDCKSTVELNSHDSRDNETIQRALNMRGWVCVNQSHLCPVHANTPMMTSVPVETNNDPT